MEFWGRRRELDRLRGELDRAAGRRLGRMLAVRGRRQSGKSRLLTELVETSEMPYLFTTAVKNAAPRAQLAQVWSDLHAARWPLPGIETVVGAPRTASRLMPRPAADYFLPRPTRGARQPQPLA